MNIPMAIARDLVLQCCIEELEYQGLLSEDEQEEFAIAFDMRIEEKTMEGF